MSAMLQQPALSHREKVAVLVRKFGQAEQVECPLTHYFAPGVYLREILMPAGAHDMGSGISYGHADLRMASAFTSLSLVRTHSEQRPIMISALSTICSK